MGGKITIDSATMMNKGLELMEAHHLFGVPYDRIDVLVHPQSLVHGLIELADGAMLAHLGPPDMRVAISYALHGGESVDLPIAPLDSAAIGTLTFEPVDLDAFPCLRLAREAALAGGTAPCVLNAANEIAVHAFLEGRLAFTAGSRSHTHCMEARAWICRSCRWIWRRSARSRLSRSMLEAFPCLRLAREAALAGGTAPCVLNAANEIAVHAFLEGRLAFNAIAETIERTLSELPAEPVRAFESLYEADRRAREVAIDAAAGLGEVV